MTPRLAVMIAVAVAVLAAPASSQAAAKCAIDSVKVGAACVDRYEASVWSIPAASTSLIKRVQKGKATLADLTGGAAVQLGVGVTDDYPCSDNGNTCQGQIYAVSIPGVPPSANITWFQAQQACGNSTKRLLTNAEWQMAAAGTPDGAPCVLGAVSAGSTGTPGCVSAWGTFDMVGNVAEFVADWIPQPEGCPGWGAFSDDYTCFAGANPTTQGGPTALIRGGLYADGTGAGVFAIDADQPWETSRFVGFRCTR